MKLRSALPYAALFCFCLAGSQVYATADPCVVDLTYGPNQTFNNQDSINQVLDFENYHDNFTPCPSSWDGQGTNKAYPACLLLVQWAIDFEESKLVPGGQCSGPSAVGSAIKFGANQIYDFSNESIAPSKNKTDTALDLSNLNNTNQNAPLLFQGSWNLVGYPTTTLVFNTHLKGFGGYIPNNTTNSMSYITIQGFVWQQKQNDADADPNSGVSATINGYTYEMSQGTFVGFRPTYGANGQLDGNGIVTIQIPSGTFPSPAALFDKTDSGQRFFKIYDNSNPSDPLLYGNQDSHATPWGRIPSAELALQPPYYCKNGLHLRLDGVRWVWTCQPQPTNIVGDWDFVIGQGTWPLPNPPSSIVCIKNKASWQDAYQFNGGYYNGTSYTNLSHGITMDHIAWVTRTRGGFIGVDGVSVTNSFIQRLPAISGQAPCIGSSGGGPQIGDYNGVYKTHGNFVSNLVTQALGDNTINMSYDTTAAAYFQSTPPPLGASQIVNSTFDNNFNAPIVLNHSPNVYVMDPENECGPPNCGTDYPVPPTFIISGNQITNCFEYDNGTGWRYPFGNPNVYDVLQPLCGISTGSQDGGRRHTGERRVR